MKNALPPFSRLATELSKAFGQVLTKRQQAHREKLRPFLFEESKRIS